MKGDLFGLFGLLDTYVGHITLLGSGDDKTCGYEEEDTCHMRRRMIRPADPGCRGAVL